jgi:hypothetical protein
MEAFCLDAGDKYHIIFKGLSDARQDTMLFFVLWKWVYRPVYMLVFLKYFVLYRSHSYKYRRNSKGSGRLLQNGFKYHFSPPYYT